MEIKNKPQTIQIFLPDGNPRSICEAEITNRLIKTIYFPRIAMEKASKREVVNFTGVYFLFGEDDNGRELVYIGEGENCWDRIRSHHREKDFWTDCIIAATKTDDYTKTDGKFLEHYCLKIAKKVGQYKVINNTGSRKPSISESRQADLLDNFDTIRILVGTLGFQLFDDKRGTTELSENEIFYCKGKEAQAQAILKDEGVLVLKGSVANLEATKTAGAWVINMRQKLVNKGVLTENGNTYLFEEDQIFKSPSAAAACVLARRANGWKEWKDKNGKTLDELKRR